LEKNKKRITTTILKRIKRTQNIARKISEAAIGGARGRGHHIS
jgi:hypothetical protein